MDAVFFITGSSRGIGKALAEAVLNENENNQVVGLSRSNSLEHSRFVHVQADLSENVSGLARELFQQYRPSKKVVLVNNAGTLGQATYLGNIDNQALNKAFALNISAPAVLMNEFIRSYGEKELQQIILNISSGAGKSAVDGWSAYCASKAALDMLSEVAAVEAGKKGSSVKVFALAPGVVDTDMQAEIRKADKQDFSRVEHFVRLKEEGELSSAESVAQQILKLLNNPDRYNSVQQDVRKF